MKKLLPIVMVSLLLSSCTFSFYPRSYEENVSYYDFNRYNSEGFFISVDSYNGSYTPVGYLDITVCPGDSVIGAESKGKLIKEYPLIKVDENTEARSVTGKGMVTRKISSDLLLSILVKKAKEKGANGLVDFKVKEFSTFRYVYGLKIVNLDYYQLSGLAIKR